MSKRNAVNPPRPTNRAGRREFLAAGVTGVAAALASACDLLSTEPEAKGESPERGQTGPEAPMLADRVKAGDLPSVDKRLPKTPMVVEPIEQEGEYGGEWRRLAPGPTTYPFQTTIAYESILRWRPETKAYTADDIIPNIAERFESNDAGTEHTFYLRPGIKWSDGEPFTADDIMFWYEDILLDPEIAEINPVSSAWLGVGAENLVRVEKVDDFTVVFELATPNALFLPNMASPTAAQVTDSPAHYLKQFHKKHASGAEKQAADEGAASWAEFFVMKASWAENPEKPVLYAWQLKTAIGESVSQTVAERNPYYWKTDPDGRQLPYIDRVIHTFIAEPETMVLRASGGDVDMQQWLITRLKDKPMYAKNREQGDYRFFETLPVQMNACMAALNLTHPNPALREVFNTKDFRVGLSHAINRQEIIDLVYQGQGEPWQGSPRPETPYHDERLAKQYTEYDPDLANELLDGAGFSDRDGQDRRLGPDGNPIAFNLAYNSRTAELVDAAELIRDYWLQVGVEVRIQPEEATLFQTRTEANEHDAILNLGGGGAHPVFVPNWYAPAIGRGQSGFIAVRWVDWYLSDGGEGEEPPSAALEQVELDNQLLAATDVDEQVRLMREILQIAAEEFWLIGVSLMPHEYGIVKNDFRNVPDVIQRGSFYPGPGPTNPEQYFWRS